MGRRRGEHARALHVGHARTDPGCGRRGLKLPALRERSPALDFDGEAVLVAPAAVRIVELDGAVTDLWLPRARSAESYRSLLAIGRREGLPIASAVVPVERDGWVSGDQLAFALRGRLEGHIEADAGRRAAPEAPMAVSVVVTTCSEPVVLARCLRSILACDHDDFEVIVVENRPHSRDTRRMLLEKFPDDPQLRYIEEEAPGLSSARNAGLEAATGDVVAFTDDDVVVDPSWIRRAAEAFAGCEEVACVTGLILPLDLETESQVLVEQFMALGKGFRRRTFRLPDARDTHPLLPYTAGVIGSGANTVVRADVARRIGGFDTTLGTGTPAAGGEDLDLYIRLLRKGHAVTYEPAAIVWHTHPDGTAELRRQVYKYGVALGATLTKQLVTGPDRGELLRAVPAGIRYARDSGSRKNTGKAASYPRHLDWLERIGMVAGPFAYLMSALSARSRKASRPPARASFNGNAPVEALVLASGQALPVVDAGSQIHDAGVRRRVVTAAAIAACLIAPLLVALDAPPGLRFAAVLAFLGLTPGTALMSALRGRPELGLVVGASLATIAVLAQSMLWLGMWEPRVLLYCAAAACLPPLAARLDLPRRTPRHAMGRIAPSALAHGLLLSAAMAAWVASIEGTDLSRIAGLGLLDALPPAYFLAFAMLIAGFVVAVTRDDLQPWLLALYVLALVAVLHGTTPLLYEEPRYPWVYKHLAVIDLIAEGDGVDRQTDIYANWPGFFAANAWLSTVGGISARAYAEWAQVFFNLVNVAALLFALRGVTGNQRLLWTSAWLFVLANWVGQDYLAPQAFGFCLSLVVFGLALRCTPLPLPPRSRVGRWWASRLQRLRSRFFHRSTIADPLPPAPMSPTPALVVGAVLYVAIVVSHQLTPVITIAGVAGLAVFSRRVPIWVPIAMVVVEIWWLACSWSYFSEHFVLFHIDPGASGAPPGYSLGAGLPGLELVGYASRVLVLLVVGLAAVGVASRLRASRHDLASAVLVVAPAIVIALQAYSGEGRYRLFLFALPWLCFFAAVACVPPRSWQLREPLRGWRLMLAGGAIGACLLPAYFGLELTNRVTHGDVAAAVWFNDHAPPDSLAVEVTENALTRLNGGYAHVIDRRFSTSPTLTNEASYRDRGLGQKDLPRIAGGLRGYAAKHTFLLLTPNQERFARLYGILPEGWRQSLERALERSRAFTRVYRNDGASIFRYEPPVSRRREVSLVWADDFDGPAGAPPDPAKWSFETGGNWQGELQAYTRDNASLDGKGHLAISARREQYTGEDGVTSAYTSARLNTRRKLVFAYGRVIARIRIPAGRGLHPAFWALGSNYGSVGWPASGEIDVMEFDSLDPRLLAGTLHGPDHTADGYFLRAYRRLPGSAARRFHEYGMTWSPGRIVFTIDGRRYGSFERGDQPRRSPWSYDHPFFLVFTLAIRTGETGGPDASTRWPATMLVDWVRVRHGRATYCPAVRAPALRGSCPRRPPPATSEAGR